MQLKLPAWARPDHPVARREETRWRRLLKKWAWLWIIVVGGPCACSALCTLSSLPSVGYQGVPWQQSMAVVGWIGFMAIWITVGLWSWILATFVSVAAATVIASEREARSWSLLRLTPMTIREALAAKLTALLRIIAWPAAGILGIEVLGTGLAAAAGLFFVLVLLPINAPLDRTTQILSAAGVLVLWPAAVTYILITSVIGLAYNASVGLLSSTLAKTTGTAVILSFVVSFGIAAFVILPVQQAVLLAVEFLAGLLSMTTQSVVYAAAPVALATVILPLAIQAVITILIAYFAIRQAERIVE